VKASYLRAVKLDNPNANFTIDYDDTPVRGDIINKMINKPNE